MNAEYKPTGWIIAGWIFTLIYCVIGLWQLNNGRGFLHVPVGISALVTAALFGAGAYLAGQNNFKPAKICWIIGGILGLPLGLVMLIGGIKLGKQVQVQADADPGSAPIPEAKPAANSAPSGSINCPACGHGFTPPRITLATQAVIARYGPNPVQCPSCKHIWSR